MPFCFTKDLGASAGGGGALSKHPGKGLRAPERAPSSSPGFRKRPGLDSSSQSPSLKTWFSHFAGEALGRCDRMRVARDGWGGFGGSQLPSLLPLPVMPSAMRATEGGKGGTETLVRCHSVPFSSHERNKPLFILLNLASFVTGTERGLRHLAGRLVSKNPPASR